MKHIILILIIMCSCGTKHKLVSTNTRSESITDISDSLIYTQISSVIDSVIINSKLTCNILIVDFDTIGRKVRETTIDINEEKDKKKVISSSDSILATKKYSEVITNKDDKKVTEEIKTDNRVVKQWWLLIGGIIAALLIWIINHR